MKNVFIDTNILLEIVLARKEQKACQQILQAGINGEINLFASYLTFANIAYILKRNKVPQTQIYQIERMLESKITVLNMDRHQLRAALRQEVKDFEDMLQYQSAMAGQCSCIVTINVKDFTEFSSLPVFSPNSLLDLLDEDTE